MIQQLKKNIEIRKVQLLATVGNANRISKNNLLLAAQEENTLNWVLSEIERLEIETHKPQ